MSKDKITVNMNIYDIPILVEELEKTQKEIERLNNIIDELEKWLNNNLPIEESQDIQIVINKLKELKEESK